MALIFHNHSGGTLVLPLLCVLTLALTVITTGIVAARSTNPFWTRAFWISMFLFLLLAAILTGIMTRWFFAAVFLLPVVLFLLLHFKI